MAASESELIRTNKKFLGPITVLDCSGLDTTRAHYSLGVDVRAQVQKFLAQKAGDIEQTAERIRRARRAMSALNSRLYDPRVSEIVKEAIRQYQASLASWSEGAELGKFNLPSVVQVVDGLPVSPEDLAAMLQEDESGCQTGVYNEGGAGFTLWHSEEDHEKRPGNRFDRLRLFRFRGFEGPGTWALIYPDLLPGPTFGWQEGDFAQAVDTLHIRESKREDAILPNTLAWISLYLGHRIKSTELVEMLSPFQGGYALTTLRSKGGQAWVEKVEFANDKTAETRMGEEAGSYLFQTNIIQDLSLPIGREEKTSRENREWNKRRLACTKRLVESLRRARNPFAATLRLLRSRRGGESAYANRDVKSYFVCRMAGGKTSIRVGVGPAQRGDAMFELELGGDKADQL